MRKMPNIILLFFFSRKEMSTPRQRQALLAKKYNEQTEEQFVAARRIQSFYRCVMAQRVVLNKRLWRWITNRNALIIQCAMRKHLARVRCWEKMEEREKLRSLVKRRLQANKLSELQETIHWRGAACEHAAHTIQTWWRWVITRDPIDDKGATSFFHAIKDAQANKEQLIAEKDRELLLEKEAPIKTKSPKHRQRVSVKT